MKIIHFAAALAAAFSFAGVASAMPAPQAASTGHYEWQQAPGFGSHTPPTAPKRVWVPDSAQTANCDCDMMRMSAADCMKKMHGKASPSSDRVTG